jgi:predicted RNase H-like HicB family nuclease
MAVPCLGTANARVGSKLEALNGLLYPFRGVPIRVRVSSSMTKHQIILYWSDEDQSFIAEVPELAGCAADGSTRQEALANVEVVINEWIETAKELGRAIPEPKGRLLFA